MRIKGRKFSGQWWPDILLFLLIPGIFLTHILTQLAAAVGFFYLAFRFICRKMDFHHPLTILSVSLGTLSVISLWFPVAQIHSAPALLPYFILLSILPHFEQTGGFRLPTVITGTKWIVILASVAGLVGIVRHFGPLERTEGLYGGYFTLAVGMAFSIPITCGLYRRFRNRFRYFILLSLAIQIAALWWTYTRTAFLAVFIGFAVWFGWEILTGKKAGKRLNKGFLALLLTVPLTLTLLVVSSSDHRINPLAPLPATPLTADEADLTSGRGGIISDALNILMQNVSERNYSVLLLGHGIRSRSRLVQSKFKSWESDYLQTLMDLGIVGLFLILGIYLFLLKRLFIASRTGDPFYRSLVIAGVSYGLMSFLTLQITSITGAAIFGVITALLPQKTD